MAKNNNEAMEIAKQICIKKINTHRKEGRSKEAFCYRNMLEMLNCISANDADALREWLNNC